MPRAKNKIYYDIEESDYFSRIGGLTFYFSKIQRLEKFEEEYKQHRQLMKSKLDYRYVMNCEMNELFDVILYRKIQKQDFKVVKGGERVWLNNLKFVGKIQT